MTKALSKAEKQRRKEERRKSNQQKPKSPTVKTVVQPKPEPASNLCDDCVYEFGECQGTPKFAGENDDRVIECGTFKSVDDVPTDQGQPAAASGPAAAEEEGPYPPGANDGETNEEGQEPELVHALEAEGATEEGKAEDVQVMTEAIQRGALDRFAKDTTDYGACPSCGRPLKRTSYSRYVDAIRCTNPRCRAYRTIVKTVSTGVK